ncbi:hypothetical protein ACP70R_008395 [Stipagrostis hirtigluma subsp. patula]
MEGQETAEDLLRGPSAVFGADGRRGLTAAAAGGTLQTKEAGAAPEPNHGPEADLSVAGRRGPTVDSGGATLRPKKAETAAHGGNRRLSEPQEVAMKFLVHVGGKFGGSPTRYGGGRVGSMTFLQPQGVDWFVMQDNLVYHGYKGDARLYYLKPKARPPEGLVLMEGLEQFEEMMRDHGKGKLCHLYIIKPAKLARSCRKGGTQYSAMASDNNDDDDSAEDETYKYNPLEAYDGDGDSDVGQMKAKGKKKAQNPTVEVQSEEEDESEIEGEDDERYTLEGEEGDEELYVLKKCLGDKGKENIEKPPERVQKKAGKKAKKQVATDATSLYLSDEPPERCGSPENTNEDETVFVHRSQLGRGIIAVAGQS